MAETVTSYIQPPYNSPQPGEDIEWANSLGTNGLEFMGVAINTMIAQKQPMLIHDIFRPEELALTPDDDVQKAAAYRTWIFKTPSYLSISTSGNRQMTLQVYLAKTVGAGMVYQIYLNGALIQTYNFTSGAFTVQWITISTTIAALDTVEFNTLRIIQTGWHGGSFLVNTCRAVRLYPNNWTTISNQNTGWIDNPTSDIVYPVPISAWGGNAPASTYLIQSMQDMLRYIYRRRISTFYNSTGKYDGTSNTSISPWSKVRVNPQQGVTQVYARFFCVRTAVTGQVGVRSTIGDTVGSAPAAIGWVTLAVDVNPQYSELWSLMVREAIIYSASIYSIDPS
jgi:hypothetical protein